jgi:hypothetical protein
MKEIKNFIDGSHVTNSTGKTFEKRTPVDNSVIGLVDTIKDASTESFQMATPDGRAALSYGVRVPRGGSPSRSRSACAGSKAGSCATCAPLSAVRSSPVSAARAASIPSSSTPSCAM